MSDILSKYEKIIFLGGGCMAERLYSQIDNINTRLIGIMDLLPDQERRKKIFHGHPICNPTCFKNEIENGAAVVVAIGCISVSLIVKEYIRKYNYSVENLFVPNPYSSLRFFMVSEELAQEDRIPFLDKRYDIVKNMFKDEISMNIYRVLEHSKPYESISDTYELIKYKDINQMYYYEEDYWKSFNFKRAELHDATIFDCGAYIGDSLIDICSIVPEKNKYYYAFEPLKENIVKIGNNPHFYEICKNIFLINCGVGEFDEEMFFGIEKDTMHDGGRFVNDNTFDNRFEVSKLSIKSIDNMKIEIKGQLYIKMDIEGSELRALKGAEKTIKKHHPFLAICLYHRKNDLLEIPLYINSLGINYDYYLRGGYHTILWAIPK